MGSGRTGLNWAEQSNREDIELGWPGALPDPRMVSNPVHVAAANEIFLMTAGRILLHEIAPVVFADAGTSSADPREEEFRADEWADHWMLHKWTDHDSDERVFIKRCLGLAAAHAPAVVLGFKLPWITPEGIVAQHSAQNPGVSGPAVSLADILRQLQLLAQATGTDGLGHQLSSAGTPGQILEMAARAGIEPATK